MGRSVFYRVTLTADERQQLELITNKGKHSAQKILNSFILLNCDESEYNRNDKLTNKGIAAFLSVSERKIDRIRKRFVDEGFEIALNGHKTKREYKNKTDGEFEAHLIALCCGEAPDGYARWTLRLLADKVVELEYIDSISYETIRRILKKTNLNPGGKKVG